MALIIDLAREGKLTELKALKQQEGANFNPNVIERGVTALLMAINKGHIDVALWLINEAKADINLALPASDKNTSEFTALFMAIQMHAPHKNMIPLIHALLINPSLNIKTKLENNKDYPGYTVLLFAILKIKPEVALLIAKSLQGELILTAESKSGMTPYFKILEVTKTTTDPNTLREFNELNRYLKEKNAHRPAVMSRSVAPTPAYATPATTAPNSPVKQPSTAPNTTHSNASTANANDQHTTTTTANNTSATAPTSASVAIDISSQPVASTTTAATTTTVVTTASVQHPSTLPTSSTTGTLLWLFGAAANFAVTAAQTISYYTRRVATAADAHLERNPGIHVAAGDIESALSRVPSSPAKPAAQSMSTNSNTSVVATTANPQSTSGSVAIPIPDAAAAPAETPPANSCLLL